MVGDAALQVRRFEFRLAGSMLKSLPPPVPFEQCRTPVQVIASEKSGLWPYEMNVHYFERLGGPKELVTLAGEDQWGYIPEFHEQYASHVIRWFTQHGAEQLEGVSAEEYCASVMRRFEEQGARPVRWDS